MSREFCETSPLHSPPHHDRIIEWLKYKQKKKNEWCFINIVHILNNCRRTNGSRMNDDPQEDGQFKRTIFCVRVSYSFSVFRFSAAYDTHSHTYTPHMPWDTCDIERNIHTYTLRDKWKKNCTPLYQTISSDWRFLSYWLFCKFCFHTWIILRKKRETLSNPSVITFDVK